MELNQRSLDRLRGVDPILPAILKEAIKTSPYEFQIPEDGGLRNAERQRQLYDKKVSKCDGFIKKSEHQKGTAFDIFLMIDKKASWNKIALKLVARHIQEVAKNTFNVNLVWGGDWKGFVDFPHFQL